MEDVKKWVDFAYVAAGIVFIWLGVNLVESVWSIFERAPDPDVFFGWTLSTVLGGVVAIGVTTYLRVNPKIYKLANECGVELKKTIWPGWAETKSNTVVVIVVVFIMGLVLWVFDILWRTLTGILYS